MTANEYRDALKRLGLSQAAAGRFLGVHEVSSRKWATGKAPVPHSVSILLRMMIALSLTPASIEEQIGDDRAKEPAPV